MQRVLLDQVGPHARQVAFGQSRQAHVEQVRDRQVQHRVAEKFQALVVVGREAAMRERELQQPRIGEGVLEARLQRDEAALHLLGARVQRDWPWYLSSQVGRAERWISRSYANATRPPCRRPS